MNNKILKLAALALLMGPMAATESLAIPIAYTLNTYAGTDGSLLNGSITVDDVDTNGWITMSELLAYSFNSTGPVTMSFGGAGTGFQCIGTLGCLSVTPTTLSFDFSSTIANDPFMNFFSGSSSVQFLETAQGGPNPISWTGLDASGNNVQVIASNGNSNVIATAAGVPEPPPTGVPEPGTLALLGLGLAGMGFARRKKA